MHFIDLLMNLYHITRQIAMQIHSLILYLQHGSNQLVLKAITLYLATRFQNNIYLQHTSIVLSSQLSVASQQGCYSPCAQTFRYFTQNPMTVISQLLQYCNSLLQPHKVTAIIVAIYLATTLETSKCRHIRSQACGDFSLGHNHAQL